LYGDALSDGGSDEFEKAWCGWLRRLDESLTCFPKYNSSFPSIQLVIYFQLTNCWLDPFLTKNERKLT
jgi:hypothetical protein